LGDGPYRQNLIDECTQLRLNKSVFFHGHQQDVTSFLLSSDAVIGCAALNSVAQESAYCGCLLILPSEKLLKGDVWQNRHNALLYETMNSDSLAQAMEYVIINRKKCQDIARQGNQTIKKYVKSIDNAGKYYIEAFQKIIDSQKQPS